MGTASATDLAGKSNIVIALDHKKGIDLSSILDELKITGSQEWTFGTGANQANCLFHDQRSTDDTGETIDTYAGGVETNAFGAVLTMEAIKLLYVKNTHATLTLEILGTAVTAIGICADPSDIIELPPGGMLLWTCPTAAGIVTTTNKNLKFAAKTAGTITFDVAIMGLD